MITRRNDSEFCFNPPRPFTTTRKLCLFATALLYAFVVSTRAAETLADLDQDTRDMIYKTLNVSPSQYPLSTLISALNISFTIPQPAPTTPSTPTLNELSGSQAKQCLPCTPYLGGLLCQVDDHQQCFGCFEAPMVVWSVSEPSINLWLSDTPFQYSASRGGRINFHLYYKNLLGTQGIIDSTNSRIFSVGKGWHTPWRSYLEPVTGQSTNFWMYLGNGTATLYTSNKIEYFTRATLTQESGTNVLTFATGARSFYGYPATIGGVTRYFVSRREDPNGNALSFSYLITNDTIRLVSVTDPDTRSTTFEYISAGGYSNLISKVIGPHGLTNTLQYDSSGRLTNCIDILGLSSKMLYDSANVTSVVTPYGTNTFTYFSNTNLMRAIKVTEHGIRNHLFLYNAEVESGKVASSYSGYRPSTTNSGYFSVANTFDETNSHLRNTFHWNPRQYERLSNLVRTSLDNGTFNVSNLASGEYLVARQLHWLKTAGGTNVGRTISLRRDGSPDGTVQGQTHWYDYPSKDVGFPDREGSSSLICLSAVKLPNGEARFTCLGRNNLGYIASKVSTYTETNGACKLRTNQYFYANNDIDLVRKVQLLGNTSRQVMSNIFNSYHQILTNYDGLNQATVVTYNSNRQAITKTTFGGLTRSNVYNSSGTWSNFVATTTAVEVSATVSFTWSNGFVLSRTDPRGLAVTYTRDAFGRRTKASFPDGTSETRTFDRFDVVQKVNRLNLTNQYAYNGFRQKTQTTNPRGAIISYNYCNCGALDSVTDANGKATQFAYDLLGRRCVTTYPGSGSITNNYNLLGQVTNRIDTANVSVTNCFNNQGMLCIVSNSFGIQHCTTYDSEDHASEVIDANSVKNRFSYDELGRVVERRDGNNHIETFGYSSVGLIARTNQLGWVTRYAYDPAGRKTAETNANGEATLFTYNTAGDLVQLRDGKGNYTAWGYDEYGRVTSKTNANGVEVLRYKYDADGYLTNRWSLAKGNTYYSYDSAGNLRNIDYPSSPDISMQYDANNRVTNMVDAVGITRFSYTDFGALLSEDGVWDSDTVTYNYTTNGMRSKLNLQQLSTSSWDQTYGYDMADRLTSITSPAGIFGYTYDPNAHRQIAKLSLPNSANITNAFDVLGRMTGTYLRNNSGFLLNSHTYIYDDASRVIRQTRTDGSYVDYGYDITDQLKTAIGKEPGGSTNRWHEQFGYVYDANGNLTNRTNNALTQSFNVDAINQLSMVARTGKQTVAGTTWAPATNVTVADNGNSPIAALQYIDHTFVRTNVTLLDGTNSITAVARDSLGRTDTNTLVAFLPATVSVAYDGNGNMLTNGTRVFEYDDENQLIRITEPNVWKSEFSYDGKMRRRLRTEFTWQAGNWNITNEVRYIYDGNMVIQERDQNNCPIVTFTRGRDNGGDFDSIGGIGGLLARTDPQNSSHGAAHGYFFADVNGNVTSILSENQKVAAKYCYAPFGDTLSSEGPLTSANNYGFSSKETHLKSGLIYYGRRYFAPTFQRWINADPSAERGDLNLFRFVDNNPINAVDAYGLVGVRIINQQGNVTTAPCPKCREGRPQWCDKPSSSNVIVHVREGSATVQDLHDGSRTTLGSWSSYCGCDQCQQDGSGCLRG